MMAGKKKSKEYLTIVILRIRVKMRVLDSGLQPGLDSYLKTVVVSCSQYCQPWPLFPDKGF